MEIMRKQFIVAGALAAAVLGVTVGTSRAANIATIEGLASGTATTLDSNPVITAIGSMPGSGDGYTYTNYAILAQDSTGSLDLFGHLPSGDTYVPTVGDTVTASGKFSPFDSIPEIGTLTALSKTGTAPVPAPLVVTPAELQVTPTNAILGFYVTLNDVLIKPQTGTDPVPGSFPVHANGSYTMTDASGNNPVSLFQFASSYLTAGALGGTVIPTGPVDITGLVDAFSGAAEVVPFSVTAVPEPTSLSLLALGGIALLNRRKR
jgi:hypothetical protein